MTHYQKLATMILRSVGLIIITYGLVQTAIIFTLEFPGKYMLFFYTLLPYLIVGITLTVISKFLAKLVCCDFDKLNEQK